MAHGRVVAESKEAKENRETMKGKVVGGKEVHAGGPREEGSPGPVTTLPTA